MEFSTPEEAQRAIAELNDTELMGRMIFVREDREVRAKANQAAAGAAAPVEGF